MINSPHVSATASAEQPKVSPAKALHKLVTEERSGRLIVTDSNDASVQWCIYFGGGQIHFAGSLMGQRERLSYVLNREYSSVFNHLNLELPSDYQMVCQYWRSHQSSIPWVRQILTLLTQEALAQFLSVAQGHLHYEPTIGLDPLLLSVPFRQLALSERNAIVEWTQIKAYISSPLQRPYIEDQDKFLQMVWSASNLYQNFQDLSSLLDRNLTLYEIAQQMAMNVLDLSKALLPLVQNGSLGMGYFQQIQQTHRPVVACVDDSPTIQQFVRLALESSGYEVLALSDPTAALPHLVDRHPIVILMDIEMPKIDGYELCRQARQVEILRQIPIVMLTGREGIIDRVRAKMAGCTAYLTKPFNPQELLTLVNKLAQSQPVAPL
ncbi:MAG TPA: response regulator [Stenomitos sp.]